MAKQPYIQFYLGDYIKDTRVLPLNVKGGWVDLILSMWDNDPKGELAGTMDDFARIMNCSKEEAILVIQTLKQKKIFDYTEEPDGHLKIISRKQKKMQKLSEIRKNAGKEGGNPNLLIQKHKQPPNQKDKQNPEYEYKNGNEVGFVFKGGVGEVWLDANGKSWVEIKNKWFEDFRWREKICMDMSISIVQVDKLTQEFVKDLELKDDYKDISGLKRHFVNWYKKHYNGGKINGGTHAINGANSKKLGTSDARTEALKKW